jgi:hypothetical protein
VAGCRTLPLDGAASRPIGTALPRASGWLVKPGETSDLLTVLGMLLG